MILLIGAAAFPGCCLVDEDLTNCGWNYSMNYQMLLVTNLTTELNTELSLTEDAGIRTALGAKMSEIFKDYANDVDLSFYGLSGEMPRKHHEVQQMDGNRATYTIYLPVDDYMNLSIANLQDNPQVRLENDELCATSAIGQLPYEVKAPVPDTVGIHHTGLFTARLQMAVLSNVDQTFNVHLYMANSGCAFVVDTTDSGVKDLQVVMTGFATRFDLLDSLYHYDNSPVVRSVRLDPGSGSQLAFYSVNFPSRDVAPDPAEGTIWEIRTYATLSDDTVTETKLLVREPLQAGQFKIIKGTFDASRNGAVIPVKSSQVGASVTLDWQSAGHHVVPL